MSCRRIKFGSRFVRACHREVCVERSGERCDAVPAIDVREVKSCRVRWSLVNELADDGTLVAKVGAFSVVVES